MIAPIFAAADIPLPDSSKVPALVASDLVLIIGMAVLIFGLFAAWVVFVRGPKNQVPARRIYKSDRSEHESGSGERRRKKKKTRRREHRQRAPTLSQTGGLPPPRQSSSTS